jgi:hypothetical protein
VTRLKRLKLLNGRALGAKIQLKNTKAANRFDTNRGLKKIQLYSFLEPVTAAYVRSTFFFKNFPGLIGAACNYYYFSEAPQTGMRIRFPPPDPPDSHPSLGSLRKNSNSYKLHLLDPGNFKKYVERTYAAVTASKNEYNCIFFRPRFVSTRLAASRYFVWIMSYYSPPEPVTPRDDVWKQ